MKTTEAASLIRKGIERPGGVWADLGAGSGTFTYALAELLGATGTVYAVDRVGAALPQSGAAFPRSGTALPASGAALPGAALPGSDAALPGSGSISPGADAGSASGSGPVAGAHVIPLVADFRGPLALPELDGAVMANSLHFVDASEQGRVLAQVVKHLRPGGAFVLVEYDLERGTPWVPYPVTPRRFAALAMAAGLGVPREIGRLRSRFGPRDIYAVVTYAVS